MNAMRAFSRRPWRLVGLTILLLSIGACGRDREEAERAERSHAEGAKPAGPAESGVRLDSAAQARAGVATAILKEAAQAREIRASGTVLDITGLADLRARYVAAVADVEKARTAMDVARRDHDRVQLLFKDNQNVSAKVVDEAAAALSTAQTARRAAQAPVRAVEATARQQWGSILATWLSDDGDALTRLLDRRDLLIQVTLPPDAFVMTPPAHASVQVVGGPRHEASFVSRAAHTDPQLQGASFFYVASAAPDLQPGATLVVMLRAGSQVRGVVVPASAVVWLNGRTWVYVQDAPDHFARRDIATTRPTGADAYLTDLPPMLPVVVQGAQTLLSEEFRAQIQVGEEK